MCLFDHFEGINTNTLSLLTNQHQVVHLMTSQETGVTLKQAQFLVWLVSSLHNSAVAVSRWLILVILAGAIFGFFMLSKVTGIRLPF